MIFSCLHWEQSFWKKFSLKEFEGLKIEFMGIKGYFGGVETKKAYSGGAKTSFL
jgi:hypothetical protein